MAMAPVSGGWYPSGLAAEQRIGGHLRGDTGNWGCQPWNRQAPGAFRHRRGGGKEPG